MRLEKFLSVFDSDHTIESYRNSLKTFLESVYGEGDTEDQSDQYFTEGRNYEEDVTNFYVGIKDRPPKTVQSRLSAVRSFLIENKIELSQLFWKRLRGKKKGTQSQVQDKTPSNDQIRKIVSHMPLQGRTFFLMLATSGMRLGETLRLKLSDLDFKTFKGDPVAIRIKGNYTKSGNPRITFISGEAKEIIEEWLKFRTQYIEAKPNNGSYDKREGDDRLFPFGAINAGDIWRHAIKKAGFEETTEFKESGTMRYNYHPHVLRQFFRTKAGKHSKDMAEALIGHEGYLTHEYRRYDEEELAEFYKQVEPELSIFTKAEELTKVKNELGDVEKQLNRAVNLLTLEKTDMGRKIEALERRLYRVTKWILGLIDTPDDPMPEEAKKQWEDLFKD